MTATVSLLLGALLGAANATAALIIVQRTRTMEPTRALRVVLGGMLLRMTVILAVFSAVLAWVPIARGAFVAGLGVLFAAGLLAEAFLLLRRPVAA